MTNQYGSGPTGVQGAVEPSSTYGSERSDALRVWRSPTAGSGPGGRRRAGRHRLQQSTRRHPAGPNEVMPEAVFATSWYESRACSAARPLVLRHGRLSAASCGIPGVVVARPTTAVPHAARSPCPAVVVACALMPYRSRVGWSGWSPPLGQRGGLVAPGCDHAALTGNRQGRVPVRLRTGVRWSPTAIPATCVPWLLLPSFLSSLIIRISKLRILKVSWTPWFSWCWS
jgi:hypothetical protein